MKVIIMRGLPGSGKSTWRKANHLGDWFCSADSLFTDSHGNYSFDPARLPEAHDRCLRRFTEVAVLALQHEVFPRDKVFVVDNTNISVYEIAPYYRLAEAVGHDVEIVQIDCPPAVAAARNVHGVPELTIGRMAEALKREQLPPWWKVTVVPYVHEEANS